MWSINKGVGVWNIRIPSCFLLAGLFVLLSGCAGIDHMAAGLKGVGAGRRADTLRQGTVVFSDVLEASYWAADALAADLRTKATRASRSMLAASFVNVNNLEESSPLGRIVAEQIASRMAQNGFRILEMKLRQHSIYINEGQGEFLLSREIKEISASQNSDLVIVGTYAVAEKTIYFSARIVNTGDNTIVTGYDYQLERNYQTDSLLKSGGNP